MNKIRLVVASLLLGAATGFAQKPFNASGTGNPIIPGYFADPTVKKFGDTYYMYATTDGSGAGFGPAQVWTSKDFVNWTLMPMNWPDSHWIWAPDVMKHTDGNYYYFYCQPCMIHCGYNPQIQISAESETKRSIFREKDKTKRSKKESAQHSKSRNKSFVMTSVSAL